MRSHCAALALLLATLAACAANRAAAGKEERPASCQEQGLAASADGGTATDGGIIEDSGRCDAIWVGTDLTSCHWHRLSVGVDPGTAFARAVGPSGVTEVPIVVEAFPARWFSFQFGTGPGPTWPSPLTVAARLHQCSDEGCTWYVGGYWEPWRKSPGLVRHWVLGATVGYRFDNHFDWSLGKPTGQVWGPHLYAAPALAVDLWSQSPDGTGGFVVSPHFQLALGWAF